MVYLQDFYRDDEFSRQCAGKKDFVTVRTDQGKVQKTKKECYYMEFKKRQENLKVGLSKFCSLRPYWCVTVDSPGMHSVCVYEIYQNLKLIVDALRANIDYKELMCVHWSLEIAEVKSVLLDHFLQIFLRLFLKMQIWIQTTPRVTNSVAMRVI